MAPTATSAPMSSSRAGGRDRTDPGVVTKFVMERGHQAPVLVSVNVGLPKNVTWGDKAVYTGAWKSPVSGPAMVRRLNIDGDGQGDLAGHGGEQRAVLVYQVDSYEYWQRHFGRDDFRVGQFGENLTVDGLPDNEVCIGDRYRIGEAEFEVTQPRVTCYRVGMRLGAARVARTAGRPPPARLLHARAERGADRGRGHDRQDKGRPGCPDGGRHRRAALPAGQGPGEASRRRADPGAQPRVAALVPRPAGR